MCLDRKNKVAQVDVVSSIETTVLIYLEIIRWLYVYIFDFGVYFQRSILFSVYRTLSYVQFSNQQKHKIYIAIDDKIRPLRPEQHQPYDYVFVGKKNRKNVHF